MTETVVIKKYANRRLYDTEQSSYVTLQQVNELIRSGRQIEVVDAKTNEIVTEFVLTQIILEEAKNKNILLPSSVLHLMIRYGDNILNDFFSKYLHQTINYYLNARTSFDNHFQKWINMSMDMSGIDPKSFSNRMPFNSFMDIFSQGDKDKKPDE